MDMSISGGGAPRCEHSDSGRIKFADPRRFLARVASYCESYELRCQGTDDAGLIVTTDIGIIEMRPDNGHVSIRLTAPSARALHMLRETIATQIDPIEPEMRSDVEWRADVKEGSLPPNFRLARIVSVGALGRSFWRLVVEGDDLSVFARDGLHLRLALPERDAPPLWPRLNARGRAVWPPSDRTHVAVYTVRSADPVAGLVTIDIFRHAGGRTSEWMSVAQSGELVGLIGPGGGWLPDAEHLVIAGDETALPAIARILETAPAGVTGSAMIEVEGDLDYPPLSAPSGVTFRIVDRARGDTLEAAFTAADFGPEGRRHLWFAAEKHRAASMRQHLRTCRGVARNETYVTGYWQRN